MKDIILPILIALLGGANVFQFLFFRSTQKKYAADAKVAETQAEHGRVDLQQDQFDYVNTQLSKIQQEYYELAAKYRETMTQHLQEIDEKCNEIASLKSRLVYFKGLRCYCSECANRIQENPYNKQQ
ncbi:MAG: hypothetical protein MJY71_02375 [Bacteroidaceae bacterium]|nr:hypothetical protein [Bacteroidaceae bacterium]